MRRTVPNPITPVVLAAASVVAGLAATLPVRGAAPDGVPRVLIDARLQERPVTLLGLDAGRVTYADAGGMVRTEPVVQYVAIAPPLGVGGSPTPPTPMPAVWLVDGQRFAGELRSGETATDHLLWRHPALGGLALAMDDVSRIALRKPKRGAAAAATETQDVLTLINGDHLAGFLESFGPTVRIEVEGQVREVPSRRVAEGALANPARPQAGLTAWLADGSVVRLASIRTSETGAVALTPGVLAEEADRPGPTEAQDDAGPPTPIGLADIVAVAFDAARLVPLAALEPVAQKPLGDRRWAEPIERRGAGTAVLGAADIALPGPMLVEWALPEGALRLAAEVELTPDLWAWGDCELVVSVVTAGGAGGRAVELRRERISAERPRVAINVPIADPDSRLRLALEPGRYGSIQDRLVLHRPIILIDAEN